MIMTIYEGFVRVCFEVLRPDLFAELAAGARSIRVYARHYRAGKSARESVGFKAAATTGRFTGGRTSGFFRKVRVSRFLLGPFVPRFFYR